MNAYLDTSALVKLLIAEPDSAALMQALLSADLFTCRVTYAEARAAIARREREKPEFIAEWVAARAHLAANWPALQAIEVGQPLVEKAGDFADAFGLRGYDAIQLAACHMTKVVMDEEMWFFSFDRQLNRAARLLGLQLPEGAWL